MGFGISFSSKSALSHMLPLNAAPTFYQFSWTDTMCLNGSPKNNFCPTLTTFTGTVVNMLPNQVLNTF